MDLTASKGNQDLQPGGLALEAAAAPLWRARLRAHMLMWNLAAAATGLLLVGWVFYGPRVLWLGLIGAAAAMLTERACGWVTQRSSASSFAHSLAMGLIVVLMLPATVPWYAAAVGAAAAVGVGKWLMGGLGHYPWHPAAVGVLLLFAMHPDTVAPQRWPLLSPEHVTSGGLSAQSLKPAAALPDWSRAHLPAGATGFALPRPETVLHQAATAKPEPAEEADASGTAADDPARAIDAAPPTGPMTAAVRDLLPGSWDLLIGAAPAAIGQGSVLALAAAGLLLIWRGYLRWVLPLAVLAGATLAAAVMPAGEAGWFPIRFVAGGEPVGLIWVGYQVFVGSTLFVAVILAGETVTSPLTYRGQILYGLGVGALTVGLRWLPVAMLAGYWAVVAMNMTVPMIDRLERRWRFSWRPRC